MASALYSAGGYPVPFYTNAALLLFSYWFLYKGCPSDQQISIDIANIKKVNKVVKEIVEKRKSQALI